MSSTIGLPRVGRTNESEQHHEPGRPSVVPAQITRYSEGFSCRSARAISRARFAPKSRCSTTLLSWVSAWLDCDGGGEAALAGSRTPPGASGLRRGVALEPGVDPGAAPGHRDAHRDQQDRERRDAGDGEGQGVHECSLLQPARSWRHEEAGRQVDALDLELLDELGPDAGRLEPALDLALDDARLLEHEHVLHHDHITLHALDLGDVGDPSRAVLQTCLVDDEVDRGRDLLADGADREVDAGHEDHRLEARQHVARAVGVAGGHRAVVARVHGLEHVQRLARTALPDDDPVGPHAQRVADELADRDLALALDVGRAGLEGDDVLLAELELGRVLDRHDPLVVRDERATAR